MDLNAVKLLSVLNTTPWGLHGMLIHIVTGNYVQWVSHSQGADVESYTLTSLARSADVIYSPVADPALLVPSLGLASVFLKAAFSSCSSLMQSFVLS